MTKRPTGVIIVAYLAIAFGLGEIWVGLSGNYLGILSKSIHPALATAIVGAFYCLGGFMLLVTRKTWGTILALGFIGAEAVGRVYLVATGVAPSTGAYLWKIIVGGLIAVAFMIYIYLRSFPMASRE